MNTFSLKAQLFNKKFNLSVTDKDHFVAYTQIKIQFCIDGMDIITFKSTADLFSLLAPVAEGEDERYILTCSCGVPDCAGYEPFMFKRVGDKLIIQIPNQRMFSPMHGLDYELDVIAFEKAQMDIMRYVDVHTDLGAYLFEPYAENETEVLEGQQELFTLSPPQHIDFCENFKIFKELTQSPAVVFF